MEVPPPAQVPRIPAVLDSASALSARAIAVLYRYNGLRLLRFIAGRAAPEPSQSLRPGRGAANIMEAPAPSKGVANPQNDVEAMTARSVPISQIENYIDTLPLGDEELSALWLLAWSQTTSPAMG